MTAKVRANTTSGKKTGLSALGTRGHLHIFSLTPQGLERIDRRGAGCFGR